MPPNLFLQVLYSTLRMGLHDSFLPSFCIFPEKTRQNNKRHHICGLFYFLGFMFPSHLWTTGSRHVRLTAAQRHHLCCRIFAVFQMSSLHIWTAADSRLPVLLLLTLWHPNTTNKMPPDSSIQPSGQQPKQVRFCDDDTPSRHIQHRDTWFVGSFISICFALSTNKHPSLLVIPIYLPVVPGLVVRLASQPHLFERLLILTVGEGDLNGLGGVSEVPHGQASVWVAAHELFPLVVPTDWMDRLHQ